MQNNLIRIKIISWMLAIFYTGTLHAQYLKVSDNKRYLVTDNGKPFFWLGDTAWELFHRLHAGDADLYLKTRAAQGFTVIQAVLLGECNGITEATPDGLTPLINNDITRPNEEYFQLVDKIIQKAAFYGLYMAILPTWGSHAQDRWHPFFANHNLFTPQKAYEYGKFLGKRYKDYPNIVWVLGGDRMPKDTEKIWDDLAKGLKEGSANKHLLTYHPEGGHSTVEFYKDFSWLDFHAFQSGHGGVNIPVWKFVKQAYEPAIPPKPIVNMEPNYENLPIGFNVMNGYFTAYDCRKAAYWSVFSGAFGHTYGHNSVWQMWTPAHKPILDADITWDKSIFSEASFQMKHLKKLILALPQQTRISDASMVTDASINESDYICAFRDGTSKAKNATYVCVYLPVVKTIAVNIQAIAAKKIKAWWYCPRTGTAYLHGEFDNNGTYTPAWENRLHPQMGGPDWVLIIHDATKNVEF